METFIKEQLKNLIGNENSIGLRDKYDVAILVIALIMKKHEFKLEGGTGSDKVVPDNWNSNTDSYTLDFIHELAPEKKFHIKSLRMGNTLLVNAMLKDKNDKIFTLDVDIDKLVRNTDFKNVDNLLLNLKEFIAIFEYNIINPMVPGLVRVPASTTTTTNVNNQQQQQQPQRRHDDDDDPLRIGEPQRGSNRYNDYHDQDPDLYPPGFPVFSNQPFHPLRGGGGGGGSYFPGFGGSQIGRDHPGFGNVHNPYANNPYGTGLPGQEQRLPRGAVPPGARFDPFGPPTNIPPSRGRGGLPPDRDDFPPPSFDPPGYI